MGISSISTFGKRGVTASLIGGLSVAVIAGAASLATPGMSLTAAHVAAPGNDLPPTGTVLPLFAPAYMGSHWSMTQAQAVTIAHDFKARLRSYQLLAEAFGLEPAASRGV